MRRSCSRRSRIFIKKKYCIRLFLFFHGVLTCDLLGNHGSRPFQDNY